MNRIQSLQSISAPILIGSEIYRNSSFCPGHPLAIPRVPTTIDLIKSLGWLSEEKYRSAPCAKPEFLKSFHSEKYISALMGIEKRQSVTPGEKEMFGIGTFSNPFFPSMFKRASTSVAGTVLAADLIAKGGRVYAIGGGLHHGMQGYANGFCFLNDIIFSVNRLRELGVSRIAYVDLDAHHCDGVEAGFREDESLFVVSLHEAKRWPFTGQIKDNIEDRFLNIPLPRFCNDNEFKLALEKLVFPLISRFNAEAIIIQGGADALADDPFSRMKLSNKVLWFALRNLMNYSESIILTGGGGYNPWSVSRLWAGFWATLNDFQIPDTLNIHSENILKNLSWSGKGFPNERLTKSLCDPDNNSVIRDEVTDTISMIMRKHRL